MADYKESSVTGNAWQRCKQIVIDNRRAAPPTLRFDEERVTALSDGDEVRRDLGSLTLAFDPTAIIQIRDPETGDLTGETITHAEFYAMMHSAYLSTALARDAAANPPEEEIV